MTPIHRLTTLALGLLATTSLASTGGEERVPAEHWMRFVDPAEAGFDAERLEAAHRTWQGLPSSAFLVVADGAVVAAWGDSERRFMCHSVRKSFLSALYGIYWDRGELELNKTLADLGLDDEPEPLLETEKRARILDLLKARSGVFHPAAYAGRTDSRPRGSEGPGRYFAYNNWDFNTLAHILKAETGADVFEAFDEHFGQPLGMEDWRVSDGYYHYELDKSKYPAYPFRLSARDAARFGLLIAREGTWAGQRVLSRHWVRRSTELYSIDNNVMGYGFMWWVFREPRFERHGMVSALGVGNQMIAALPDSDLVIVNRANTYEGEGTPMGPLLDLIEQILEARTGEVANDPVLAPLDPQPQAPIRSAEEAGLEGLVGTWPDPPAVLGFPARAQVEVSRVGGNLVRSVPGWGTFALYPQPDGTLLEEDSLRSLYPIRDDAGAWAGIADEEAILIGALFAAAREAPRGAEDLLARLPAQAEPRVSLARALILALSGDYEASQMALEELGARPAADDIEAWINASGHEFLRSGVSEPALTLFELNTLAFPKSSNAWDSLAEVHTQLGNSTEALEFFQTALTLDSNNANARARIAQLREATAER